MALSHSCLLLPYLYYFLDPIDNWFSEPLVRIYFHCILVHRSRFLLLFMHTLLPSSLSLHFYPCCSPPIILLPGNRIWMCSVYHCNVLWPRACIQCPFRHNHLNHQISKYGSQSEAPTSPWNLLEYKFSGSTWISWVRTLGVSPSHLCFNKPFQRLWYTQVWESLVYPFKGLKIKSEPVEGNLLFWFLPEHDKISPYFFSICSLWRWKKCLLAVQELPFR